VAEELRPWMLALDTSTAMASVAVGPMMLDSGKLGAEAVWNAGRHQTTTVLAEVDHLLRLARIDVHQLGAVAVTTGPGSFNALRVGMSVAKGLAFGLDLEIFGIGSLDVAAAGVAYAGRPVRAFIEAGRGRVVVGDYRAVSGRLELRGELIHRTVEELADGLLEPTVFAGEITEGQRDILRDKPNVILPLPSANRRRAALLLDLAAARWRDSDADDLLALEPMYIHSQPASAAKSEQNR
jgi:tRNA threonylcarbamoyladenosine biosynthesis protein TsaB